MKTYSAETQAALKARAIAVRDFLWLEPRDRTTGAVVGFGFWSDVGAVSAEVIDPLTGATEARAFAGAGTLISIDGVARVANLTVQPVTITMSQLGDGADEVLRSYDPRFARVELYQGVFIPGTQVQLAPAECQFYGRIDTVRIDTPVEGGEGKATLDCVSETQQLTRGNPTTRSDSALRQRLATDSARRHVATVGTWDIRWGSKDSRGGGGGIFGS